ncbi:MAG: BlaI/MecI/CopY family transcriptional regulator [Planctomycetes bacterium]|nr:BlaI/MecI/CopY family transcriptional regulator [Planctomycetota bacterium]
MSALPRATDAELSILDSLWRHGPSTIRELTDRLYPRGSTSEYATVQKLLERLESKSLVHRDRSSHAHQFEALVERDALVGSELQEVATKLCEGSLTPLLMNLVRDAALSDDERAELRRLLDESDATSGEGDR